MRHELCRYLDDNAAAFSPLVCGMAFADYVHRMRRNGEWGDHLILLAAEEVFDRPVELYDNRWFETKGKIVPFPIHLAGALPVALLAGVSPIVLRWVVVPAPSCLRRASAHACSPAWCSYHGGNHYNSVRVDGTPLPLPARSTTVIRDHRLAGGSRVRSVRKPHDARRDADEKEGGDEHDDHDEVKDGGEDAGPLAAVDAAAGTAAGEARRPVPTIDDNEVDVGGDEGSGPAVRGMPTREAIAAMHSLPPPPIAPMRRSVSDGGATAAGRSPARSAPLSSRGPRGHDGPGRDLAPPAPHRAVSDVARYPPFRSTAVAAAAAASWRRRSRGARSRAPRPRSLDLGAARADIVASLGAMGAAVARDGDAGGGVAAGERGSSRPGLVLVPPPATVDARLETDTGGTSPAVLQAVRTSAARRRKETQGDAQGSVE